MSQIGRYTIDAKLGSGGFGVVYRGTSLKDGKDYAIKVLESANDQDAMKRFRREVRIHSQLKHTNIIPILDFDLDVERPWFAMPIAQCSLRECLQEPLEEDRAVSIFRNILAGMSYAHAEGVIHRDLKPENVLFLGKESIAISDFGLGRRIERDTSTITRTNIGIGTIEYMAPEQFTFPKGADKRADVYALGKILYEMLTGQMPFPSLRLELLPGRYQYLVGRCVKIDAGERFSSARRVASELELLLKEEDLEAPDEKSGRLLKEILSLSPKGGKDVQRLNEILQREASDGTCLQAILPRIPLPLLEAYTDKYRSALKDTVEAYDRAVSGPLDWDYTDIVADFYSACFGIIQEVGFQSMLIKRLLDMGYRHNRFHVRDVFWRMVSSVKEVGLAHAVVNVVKDNVEAAAWMAERVSRYNLAPAIEKAFKKAVEGQAK